MEGIHQKDRLANSSDRAMLVIRQTIEGDEGSGLAAVENVLKNSFENNKGIKSMPQAMNNSSHEKILYVQYNPSSLSVRANAETIKVPVPRSRMPGNASGGDEEEVEQRKRGPSVVMSLELMFDQVNGKDAFLFERGRISIGDAASGLAALAKTDGYSVRTQMNGIMAMIMDPNVTGVTFVWRDMIFSGKVSQIDTSYTMFNPSGEPVRGTIRLDISQTIDGTVDTYWSDAFHHYFGD